MNALVKICKVGRGVDLWMWLCHRCLEAMKAKGWALREEREPPHELRCDGLACRRTR